jgi:hypothetical protein
MERRLAELDEEAVARVEQSATLDFEELVQAQQTQSALFAAGLISQDVAQWVYRVAGGEIPSPSAFAEQPLAVRVTFIKLFEELLQMKIKLQQGGSARRVVA